MKGKFASLQEKECCIWKRVAKGDCNLKFSVIRWPLTKYKSLTKYILGTDWWCGLLISDFPINGIEAERSHTQFHQTTSNTFSKSRQTVSQMLKRCSDDTSHLQQLWLNIHSNNPTISNVSSCSQNSSPLLEIWPICSILRFVVQFRNNSDVCEWLFLIFASFSTSAQCRCWNLKLISLTSLLMVLRWLGLRHCELPVS